MPGRLDPLLRRPLQALLQIVQLPAQFVQALGRSAEDTASSKVVELRPGQFQALYDQINALPLGHLAGGIHRDNLDFFNVYYGAVGLPHYSDKIR